MTTATEIKEQVNNILVENNLDFEIIKKPMVLKLDDNTHVNTDYYGLFNSKSGNVINSVKKGYTVTQNADIVESVVKGMQGFGDLDVRQAGSINDGRKVYIQLGIKGLAKVGGDDLERYVTIIDSNDGSTGLSVGLGNTTLSCQNQFFHFHKSNQYKFRHTATVTQKVKVLHELIAGALKQDFRLMELFNKFQSTDVSKDLAHQLVNQLVGVDRTASKTEIVDTSTRTLNAMDALYNSIEQETNGKGQNLWGLFSSVTHWSTHVKASPKRENGRLESIMVGNNYKTNKQALEFCEAQLPELV